MLRRFRSVTASRRLDVMLMSKPGCELCEKAERATRRVFGVRRVRIVNILEDRALEDMYVFRIPVLVVDGVEVAEGLITIDDARRARRLAVRERSLQ